MTKNLTTPKIDDTKAMAAIDDNFNFYEFRNQYRTISKLFTAYVAKCHESGSEILLDNEDISNIQGTIELLQQLDDSRI
jgi:hypothetical protein